MPVFQKHRRKMSEIAEPTDALIQTPSSRAGHGSDSEVQLLSQGQAEVSVRQHIDLWTKKADLIHLVHRVSHPPQTTQHMRPRAWISQAQLSYDSGVSEKVSFDTETFAFLLLNRTESALFRNFLIIIILRWICTRTVSQAAACDGQVYTVNYSNTQLGA